MWRMKTSWWFQPIWKIFHQNGNLPQVEMNIKNIWNHHPGPRKIYSYKMLKCRPHLTWETISKSFANHKSPQIKNTLHLTSGSEKLGCLSHRVYFSRTRKNEILQKKKHTPLKTNMTLENPHFQSEKKSQTGRFSIVMLVFWGVVLGIIWISRD